MDIEKLELSDINFLKMKLIKESTSKFNEQDHSRWVFKDNYRAADGSRCTRYLKVWNPQYIRRDNILGALEAKFYDETTVPALTGLIYHQEVCRGYVTQACELTHKIGNEFYENLKRKTVECGFYAIQYSRYHIGHFSKGYSLFDLEGVHPIRDLPEISSLRSSFDDENYGLFVVSQFVALYPSRIEELGNYEFMPIPSWRSNLRKIADAIYPLRLLRRWLYAFRQWMKIRRSGSHAHQIEL